MHQVGDNQSDHEGTACGQAARHPVGLIVYFFDAGEYPAARLCADVGASANYLGHRHYTDVEIAGYVLQANRRAGRVRHINAPNTWRMASIATCTPQKLRSSQQLTRRAGIAEERENPCRELWRPVAESRGRGET